MTERERLVEVEEVDAIAVDRSNKSYNSNSSINKKGDIAIDNFMTNVTSKDS